jgi:hypothetical protein
MSANPFLGGDAVAEATEEIAHLDKQEVDLRTHTTGFGGMPVDNSDELAEVARRRAQAESALSSARWGAALRSLLIVRWAVPALALGLLWLGWTGKENRTATLAAGGAGILTTIVIVLYRRSLVGGGGDENSLGGMMAAQMDAAISVGIGTWLIGLIGVGLVLSGLGILRNPLAARA